MGTAFHVSDRLQVWINEPRSAARRAAQLACWGSGQEPVRKQKTEEGVKGRTPLHVSRALLHYRGQPQPAEPSIPDANEARRRKYPVFAIDFRGRRWKASHVLGRRPGTPGLRDESPVAPRCCRLDFARAVAAPADSAGHGASSAGGDG